MSVFSGPNFSTSGLVFSYDASNIKKSWKGAPTTNLWIYSRAFSNWNKTAAITVTDNSAISPNGDLTASTVTASGAGGSYINLGGTLISSGSTYTKSVYAKAGTTSTLVFESYDNNGSGGTAFFPTTFNLLAGTYTTSSGDTATMTYISNGWYKCSVTRSYTLTTGSGTFYIGAYGTGLGTLYLWDAQLELGSYATPVVATSGASASRSTTQAITDLTGNNTITATSLTYASDGTFSFNGTSSKLTTATLQYQFLTTGFTLSTILDYTQTTTNDNVISWGLSAFNTTNYAWELRIRGSGNVEFSPGIGPGGTGVPVRTSYSQSPALSGRNVVLDITYTANGLASIYENGVLKATNDYTGVGTSAATNALTIGQGSDTYFPGKLYRVSLYNKPLTALEVQQNFNAVRGRFGI